MSKGRSIEELPPLTDAELAVLGPRYPPELHPKETITHFSYAHIGVDGTHVPCPACNDVE